MLPACKDMNVEAEEATELEAITRRQTGEDPADWEDLVHAVVNCSVCELVTGL
jgi:hypothetical protein